MRRSLAVLPLFVLALPAFAEQLYLNVQPVQICDSAGSNCADPAQQLFADFTNAIWAQADITVNFLPWQTIDNTSYDTGTGFTDAFQNAPLSLQPDAALDYLYFLPQPVVDDAFGSGILGEGYVGLGVALISDSVFGFNSGDIYPDVISHELGHDLGLVHILGSQYLMNAIDSNANESLSDVYPSGNNDQITADEAAEARQSSLLTDAAILATPEPGTLGLAAFALLGAIVVRRRERRSQLSIPI